MKVLVKTKDLSRDEWLRYRTKGIGGSDVSIIAGINPYKSVYRNPSIPRRLPKPIPKC